MKNTVTRRPVNKILLLSLALAAGKAGAQEASKFNPQIATSRWSLRIELAGLGGDMGGGISVMTPELGSSRWAIALGVIDYGSSLAPSDFGSSNPASYANLYLKFLESFEATESLKFYYNFSVGALFPTSNLATKTGMNLIPAFGLEYFPRRVGEPLIGRGVSFYGEFGASWALVNSTATQIASLPTYGSGALISIGVRTYF